MTDSWQIMTASVQTQPERLNIMRYTVCSIERRQDSR